MLISKNWCLPGMGACPFREFWCMITRHLFFFNEDIDDDKTS
jgi:hypothetical protein